VRLGSSDGSSAPLTGFNEREPWGAWTGREVSEVELPRSVAGKVRLHFFGWVLPDRQDVPIRLTIGDATRTVKMTSVGADYALDFDVNSAADRVRISLPTTHPADSHRDMGVAIGYLRFERP
jgi:hypothetical protein